VKYEKPMTAVEDIEAQIKVLQSKLEFYKELERTKTPVEKAYMDAYGLYPITDGMSGGDMDYVSWDAFQKGYKSAQKDYKVGEYQETAQERGERLHKDVERVVKESVKWCEEHPDTDPLDWLKPQTPEETENGLKEAFREAVKQGVVSSSTKSQTLYDLIADWWDEIFLNNNEAAVTIESLIDEISLWLPTEHETNSYKWNQCIRMIREKLR
jgi:hypothetical protein